MRHIMTTLVVWGFVAILSPIVARADLIGTQVGGRP
jgi:hypothetical protein